MNTEKSVSNTSNRKDSVSNTSNRRENIKKVPNLALPPTDGLMPQRHPQDDLFLCDIADAVFKDIQPSMEHPFFSLSKKPDHTPRFYEHGDKWINIRPSVEGMPTLYDKDVLIYAISQLIAALNRGEKISHRLRINSRDFLVFSNKNTSGQEYAALEKSLFRLRNTSIETNIVTSENSRLTGFGLIDKYEVARKTDLSGKQGKLLWIEITLSEWVFDAIRKKSVLTLHPDYFRLRKPLERRLYEIARKHCGHQSEWTCKVDTLYTKSGSRSRCGFKPLPRKNRLPV